MAFSNYGGIIAPSSVTSKDDVRRIQRQLGVQVDGLWGPKTQAAYEASQRVEPAYSQPVSFDYGTTDLDALQDQIYSKLSAPSISYQMPSQKDLAAQISEYLRPGYDSAINQRKQQTLQNRAAIDADAASRGMGRSSYVTDVKDQAMDAEAADIADLEGAYNAALLQSVMDQYNQHLSNKMAADQYNASAEAAARQAALGYSTSMYQNNLAKLEEEAAKSGSRGSSGSSKNTFSLSQQLQLNEEAEELLRLGGRMGMANALSHFERYGDEDEKYGKGAKDYILSYVEQVLNP